MESKKKDNKSSWIIFTMAIGFLIIAMAPQTKQMMFMIIAGLVIILMAVILLKKQKNVELKNQELEKRKQVKRNNISK